MGKVVPLGRVYFGIALIAFGILQFIFGDFIPGRAPAWPETIPGSLIWAYASGAFLIFAGASIMSGKFGSWPALATGVIIFVWALLRNLPAAFRDTGWGLAWTQTGKALALFGGAFAVAASLSLENGAHTRSVAPTAGRERALLYLGRFCLGAFLISSGFQHFKWVKFVVPLAPTWVPGGGVFWTYFAGVALIAGGLGLMIPKTARLAGLLSGLMIFLWVLMLHIPRAIEKHDRNDGTAVFEALAMSGIALVVAQTLTKRTPEQSNATA